MTQIITPPTPSIDPAMLETQMDRDLWQRALSLDTPQKLQIRQQMLLEKWSGRGTGSYDPNTDWIGEGSVARGFPEIKGESNKLALALLLENQHTYQKSKKMRVVNGEVLVQDTTTADEALPTKFAFPLVRRVFAQVVQADWSTVQAMPGPSAFVFYLDFLRENDGSNILSVEYNWMLSGELGVPPKAKLSLQRQLVQAVKQIMGIAFSLESLEDAQAQLGLNVESELLNAFAQEFVRALFARHLLQIQQTAGMAAIGTSLPGLWAAGPAAITMPNIGSLSMSDYKTSIYNKMIDANTLFQRLNRQNGDGVVAGLGLAGFLRKLLTATATSGPNADLTQGLGITNYGVYAEHWNIWATEFLPDNVGFMYHRSADALHAGHIYAPYIPVQVMPAVYADYDATTGNYQNRDAMTRNIRERSASVVTRPYAFVQINGPSNGLSQGGNW